MDPYWHENHDDYIPNIFIKSMHNLRIQVKISGLHYLEVKNIYTYNFAENVTF